MAVLIIEGCSKLCRATEGQICAGPIHIGGGQASVRRADCEAYHALAGPLPPTHPRRPRGVAQSDCCAAVVGSGLRLLSSGDAVRLLPESLFLPPLSPICTRFALVRSDGA